MRDPRPQRGLVGSDLQPLRGLWAWAGATRLFGWRWASVTAVLLLLVWGSTLWSGVHHDRHAAVRVQARSAHDVDAVLRLSHDVWSEQVGPGEFDVVVSPEAMATLRRMEIPFDVLVPDVQAAADAERTRLAQAKVARPDRPGEWFAEYRDFETIIAYMHTLAELRPELASLRTIGHSLEGRPLTALRISSPQDPAGEPKLGMLVNGGLHAREWIGVMVPICIADRLLRGYDRDPQIHRFVDNVELFVVPVVNPDGYEYSWEHNRYWRKNRRGDYGVDLNRNFGVGWGGKGSSGQRRSQVYRGSGPFSEPEAAALRDVINAERIDAHVDFHSYGQLLLHPWGYKKERSKDHSRFAALADRLVSAIHATHGKRYRLMPAEQLYAASGTLMDWSYGAHGVMSFVVELRPRGGNGFVLPPEQIVPTCDEALAAVLELGRTLAEPQP